MARQLSQSSMCLRAVVTGAGSGIGRAFALKIGRRGGRVVCADIEQDRAEETVALLRQAGADGCAIAADVASMASMQSLADAAAAYFGEAPTLVVNNAGVGAGGTRIGDTPLEDWQWVLGVNLWGVIHGCHVFMPMLREAGFGGVINICSTASFAAAPTMGAYNASKAGALAVTETLAAECAGSAIKVTAVCPTFVRTNIVRDGRIEAGASALAGQLMEKWAFTPEKVVAQSLRALERGQLYVVPQMDAKVIWRAKRLLPSLYTRGAGQLNRLLGRGGRSSQSVNTDASMPAPAAAPIAAAPLHKTPAATRLSA